VSSTHALRALRHRNFRLFFAGQLISLVGTWMQSVAQSWLIYRLTHSALLLGAVGFAGQIPIFLIAPVGGHVADRHDRRRIIILTQTASMILAFVLAALTLTGRVAEWHIIVLAALLGIVNAFDMPARQAFIVQMVEREDLMNAIALNSSMFNGARVVGPAVAGILVAAIGEGWCFFANGISYIAVLAGLFMMTTTKFVPRAMTASALRNIVEGLQFVARTAPIRALLLLIAVVSFTAMPYAVLMPVFADNVLHAGARGLGILMGASGVGALAGSIMLALRSTVRGLGTWVAVSAALFGATLIAFGLSRNLWLSVLILVPLGASMMVQMSSSNTLIQSMVPDELRGRVMAAYTMMFMGMGTVGSARRRDGGRPRRRAGGGDDRRGHHHHRGSRLLDAAAGAARPGARDDPRAATGRRRSGGRDHAHRCGGVSMSEALIIVDVQYDFMPGGALPARHGDDVVPVINRVQALFDVVIATQDWHPANHGSFASNHPGHKPGDVVNLNGLQQILWPDHCVQGSHGAELHRDLDRARIAEIVRKGTDPGIDSYSTFFDNGRRKSTGLERDLRARGVTDVYLAGLATDYCVLWSARDALELGFRTHAIADGCRGVDLQPGDSERAFEEMRTLGIDVLASDALVTARAAR
jgi:nicotinamidase-related amidase/MFS family permease